MIKKCCFISTGNYIRKIFSKILKYFEIISVHCLTIKKSLCISTYTIFSIYVFIYLFTATIIL
jgi:hypothetical protein